MRLLTYFLAYEQMDALASFYDDCKSDAGKRLAEKTLKQAIRFRRRLIERLRKTDELLQK